MQHKPHHVTQFLDACGCAFSVFLQGSAIQGVEDVEQEMGVDLRPQETQAGRCLSELRLEIYQLTDTFLLPLVYEIDERKHDEVDAKPEDEIQRSGSTREIQKKQEKRNKRKKCR